MSDKEKIQALALELNSLKEHMANLTLNSQTGSVPSPSLSAVPSDHSGSMKLFQFTLLDESSRLMGHPHAKNNWDDFSFSLSSRFAALGIWNSDSNTPLAQCSAFMISRNLHPSLASKYRDLKTSIDLWT
jgi:hypothetical protein